MMAEPVQTTVAGVSIVTLFIAVFGPMAGPYLVILLGSIGGSLWALSSAALETRTQGAWLMIRCAVTAVMLTALIAQNLGPLIGLQVTEIYGAVAFVIGMLGNRWQEIIDSIKVRLQAFITGDSPQATPPPVPEALEEDK